jgi:glucose-1-phosphatase
MIKALIFDCFGVLYWDDLNRMYDLVGVDNFQNLNDIMHACDHGYISGQDFLDQVSELAGISTEAVASVMRDKQSPNTALMNRVKELKAEYKIGLLSNMGYDTLKDVFSERQQQEMFDDVLISSEVGLIKPSQDLYELALERLGVAPDEAIFIDDRLPNIEGAQQLGMKTILFTTNKQFEQNLERTLQESRA